jgi:hypothetical protein
MRSPIVLWKFATCNHQNISATTIIVHKPLGQCCGLHLHHFVIRHLVTVIVHKYRCLFLGFCSGAVEVSLVVGYCSVTRCSVSYVLRQHTGLVYKSWISISSMEIQHFMITQWCSMISQKHRCYQKE